MNSQSHSQRQEQGNDAFIDLRKLGTPRAKTPFQVEHGPNATLEFYNDGDGSEQQETNTESS